MLKPMPPGFSLGVLTPEEAVAAFKARGLIRKTFHWADLWHEEHQRAFTVSRLSEVNLLEFIQAELGTAVAEGTSLREFSKAVMPRLQQAGWWGQREVTDPTTGEIVKTRFDPSRLKLIYDTNLRQSHNAANWAQIERNKALFPLVVYRTMRDERVRTSHKPWDNVTLPVDHPWWDTHTPQNGWGCRCRVFSISRREFERRQAKGENLKTEAPPIQWVPFLNKASGKVEFVPRGIDPGWGYNPGKQQTARAGQALRAALDKATPSIARVVTRQVVTSAPFASFVAAPVLGEQWPVAVLTARQASAVGARQTTVMLGEAAVTKQLAHQPGIGVADYQLAQRVIDTGEQLVDQGLSIVFVGQAEGGVVVVKATRTGQGLWLTSLRRLTAAEARRDSELRRLRA